MYQGMSGYIAGRPSRIPDEAMEVIADVLLACTAKDDQSPAYNEAQLARKTRRASPAEEHFGVVSASLRLRGEIGMGEMDDPDYLADDERTIRRLYSEGYRISEIVRETGASRYSVMKALRTIARKTAAMECRYSGLDDVYYSEVRKRIYRRPSHCLAQPCRRLGYCKFALGEAVGVEDIAVE